MQERGSGSGYRSGSRSGSYIANDMCITNRETKGGMGIDPGVHASHEQEVLGRRGVEAGGLEGAGVALRRLDDMLLESGHVGL